MGLVKVHSFARWFLLSFFVLLTVSGCGREGGRGDTLRVSVQIPTGENEGLFWFGVDHSELEVSQGNEKTLFPWAPGQEIRVELQEGDQLAFFAYDKNNRLLVTGLVVIDQTKMVSIPVRRVL